MNRQLLIGVNGDGTTPSAWGGEVCIWSLLTAGQGAERMVHVEQHLRRQAVGRCGTLPRSLKVIVTGALQRGRICTVLS